jgi:CarboxypepD_reg-like domain/Secretion system C-terminal sorting domain
MQSVQLSIPKPCHENWDKMTPTQQGRFCNACAKQVVDFTTMSDGEVLNFFLKNKTENVCGRTLPQQLDRVLEVPKPIVPTKLWYWKYAAAAGLLLMGKEGMGQEQNLNTSPKIAQTANTIENIRGEIAVSANKIIKGVVKNVVGDPMPFANVSIKNTNNTVQADANGKFSIKHKFINDAILVITAVGFEVKEVTLNTESERMEVTIQMLSKATLGLVAIEFSTENREPVIETKNVAVIKVKDNTTGKLIHDAKLFIKGSYNDLDTIQLKNGQHKIKRIKKYDRYIIQASKDGYVSRAIEISAENFNKRKGIFEIELEKIKAKENFVEIKPKETKEALIHGLNGKVQGLNILPADRGNSTSIRVTLGQVRTKLNTKQALIVLDRSIVDNSALAKLNPKDIDSVKIIKGAEALALFGSAGEYGVFMVATKKQNLKKDSLPNPNYKTMEEVAVVSYGIRKCKTFMGAVTKVTTGEILQTVKTTVTKTDTLKQKIINLFSPIKIYPNPAQKGQPINISFSNKYNSYTIQVANALGVVVLNQRRQNGFKEVDAFSKKITEQIIISPQWSSGYYLINILNEQGKVIAKNGFLVL